VALSRAGCVLGEDCSVISARKERLIQRRAGEAFPKPYGKPDIWKLNFWISQEREKKRSWSCEL